jgi:hypothetical protein
MKKKIGLGILTFLPLFAATVESRACIGHFLKDEWPPHEMFHLLMGLSGLLATYTLILILVWIPLRHGQRAQELHGHSWQRIDGVRRNHHCAVVVRRWAGAHVVVDETYLTPVVAGEYELRDGVPEQVRDLTRPMRL